MTRRELAESNFVAGYSCAQAVVKAFADVTGFDGEAAMRLCSSFGGGMGRLREVCGAVSGMFIVGRAFGGLFRSDRTRRAGTKSSALCAYSRTCKTF